MRADRLVAALLVLQARGRITAADLALELEVSERTARRDLEALAMAGVPVYPQRGRGGGWFLVGGARTDLSGLSADEARALFLLAGPAAGTTPELKSALRKLVHALPATFRPQAEAAASAVVVDPAGWDRTSVPSPPYLDPIQRAVVGGVQVELGYARRDGVESERRVHPLGLVNKGSVWYLVADTDAGLRTFRVDRVRSMTPTEEPARRPDGFDLAEAWRQIATEIDERRATLPVVLHVEPDLLGWLRAHFGTRIAVGDALPDGRVQVELRAHSVASAAANLAAFGAGAEVVSPDSVRDALAHLGAGLARRYGSSRHRGSLR